MDDMLATTGTAFLGMTLGCARCHEHKYDPIPQQDYYRLIATLARTDSTTRQMDPVEVQGNYVNAVGTTDAVFGTRDRVDTILGIS